MLENKDRVSVRLTKQQKQSIEFLVLQGKYKNKTSFVRQSITALLNIENVQACMDTLEENDS